LQDEYESFYCIVNLHAITLPQDPRVLRQKTLDLARIYLAAGINPEKSTVFIQSDVPEHAELTWILSCQSRMGELERMTQFKDKSGARQNMQTRPTVDETIAKAITTLLAEAKERSGEIPEPEPSLSPEVERTVSSAVAVEKYLTNRRAERAGVGLFTYPVLMASDILLYQTDLVPIGQDQKQHLELTRDLAERFNRDFGETFVIPEPFIPPVGAKIMSLQDPTKKMSKSDENANASIFLLDDADTITKKFKKAVTDSGTEINFDETRPAIKNLLTIYQLLTGKSADECVAHFAGCGYAQFKGELAETTIEFLRPFQERVNNYTDADLGAIIKAGAEKARSVASETLNNVYQRTGIR
ncbi:MAG: tryptophan--tRNA ligase, partial [Pyrinomonadaceae bacterium]